MTKPKPTPADLSGKADLGVTPSAPSAHADPHEGHPDVTRRLRSRFVAGLVLVVPVWVSVVVIGFIFRLLRDTSLWLIEAALLTPWGASLLTAWGLERNRLAHEGLAALPLTVQWVVSALSVVLTIVLLYVLGAVTTNVVGHRLVRLAETFVDRLPLVKPVYFASKKVLEALSMGETRPFQQVVLIPFPTKDMQSVGFVTHIADDEQSGEKLYTIFVPMAPHLTSGFVFFTPQTDLVVLNWTIEQALKVIISGGMLRPDNITVPHISAAPPAVT